MHKTIHFPNGWEPNSQLLPTTAEWTRKRKYKFVSAAQRRPPSWKVASNAHALNVSWACIYARLRLRVNSALSLRYNVRLGVARQLNAPSFGVHSSARAILWLANKKSEHFTSSLTKVCQKSSSLNSNSSTVNLHPTGRTKNPTSGGGRFFWACVKYSFSGVSQSDLNESM